VKLIELDPRWLMRDGRRIGIVFRTPHSERPQSAGHYQTCFFEPTPRDVQREVVWAAADDLKGEGQQHFGAWQPANPDIAWTVAGGVDGASLETLTVTPSIDGSRGGLWHGFITEGEIR
jgi:hypothetical protein